MKAKQNLQRGDAFSFRNQVMALGFVGWVIPTLAIKSDIPLYHGESLTGAFASSIGGLLQQFPIGPGVSDPFWLLCFVWHSGGSPPPVTLPLPHSPFRCTFP